MGGLVSPSKNDEHVTGYHLRIIKTTQSENLNQYPLRKISVTLKTQL